MSQVFKPSVNTFARLSLLVAGLAGAIGLSLVFMWDRSPLLTRPIGIAVEQPVRFSHKLHSDQLNIECRYCHESAEQNAYGGIPDTHTCMSCHSQIATYSELLEPVRRSYATGENLEWNRVHDLAEHVYFNHAVHVQNGFGCSTCHGQVNEMQLVWQQEPMTMAWCLDCHQQPEQYVRPVSEIYNFDWQPPENQLEVGQELLEEYNVRTEFLTNCRVCHH